jgi:hypothetical protein
MQPSFGPVSYTVGGITDVAIGAGLTLGPIRFRFPRAVFVSSIIMHERTGDPARLARLRLRIQDETSQDIITDGRSKNTVRGATINALTCLDGPFASGLVKLRAFPIQRPVLDGDQWFISVTNDDVADRFCELHLQFEEAFRGK